MPEGYIAADASAKPLGMEIALVTDSVNETYTTALAAGAVSLKAPMVKPWGQTVAFLQCPDGTLAELCSPINS